MKRLFFATLLFTMMAYGQGSGQLCNTVTLSTATAGTYVQLWPTTPPANWPVVAATISYVPTGTVNTFSVTIVSSRSSAPVAGNTFVRIAASTTTTATDLQGFTYASPYFYALNSTFTGSGSMALMACFSQWGGGGAISVTQGTTPWIVAGNLSNNNAAPGANNVGVLPAIANAGQVTYTEGFQVLGSVDLKGNWRQRVMDAAGNNRGLNIDAANNAGVSLNEINSVTALTGGVAGSLGVGGLAANGALPSGNPNLIAGSDGTNIRSIRTDTSGDTIIGSLTPAGGLAPFQMFLGNSDAQTVSGNIQNIGMALFNGTSEDRLRSANSVAGTTGTGLAGAGLMGFDGTNWDRIAALTHNNAAPTALGNLGVLPAIANAAAPTFTEGNQTLASVDLKGQLRNVPGPAQGSTSALAKKSSTALEASRVAKASAGAFYGVVYTNQNAATRYLMCFDASSLPANGTFPDIGPVQVPTLQSGSISTGQLPVWFTTGIVCAHSTTQANLTVGRADGVFQVYTQ